MNAILLLLFIIVLTILITKRSGANPNVPNMDGEYPLVYAIRENCTQLVRDLIRYGASMNFLDKNSGKTVFQLSRNNPRNHRIIVSLAVLTRDPELVEEMVVEYGITEVHNICTPLHWAALIDDPIIVKKLFSLGYNLEAILKEDDYSSKYTPLQFAWCNRSFNSVNTFIEIGANNDRRPTSFSPFWEIAEERYPRVVKKLLEINEKLFYLDPMVLLESAHETRNEEILQLFKSLELGVYGIYENFDHLQQAVRENNVKKIKRLVQQGISTENLILCSLFKRGGFEDLFGIVCFLYYISIFIFVLR